MSSSASEKHPSIILIPVKTKLAPTSAGFPRSNRRFPSPLVALFVTIFASALFATFVSPQFGLLGRGLRSSLPLFILLFGFMVFLTPKIALKKTRIFIIPTFLGIALVTYGVIQNFLQPNPDVFHAQVYSLALCMMIWIAISLLRSLYPASLESVRWITLIVFSVSLGIGIPLLIQQPGIARLTAGGNPLNPNNEISLYLSGIGNYRWYTAAAVAWPAIANWLLNKPRKRLTKIIGWSLLLITSVSVLFSTFTMALVLLLLGILAWLVLFTFSRVSRANRWTVLVVLVALFVGFPKLYGLALGYDPMSYSVAKATRMINLSLSSGLAAGDETGRVDRLVKEMSTFIKNPIFGAWGFDTSSYFIGGHSSWGDTLALQGVFGLSLYLGFLSPSWRRRKQSLSISAGVAGGTLSWILFCLAGVLNPIFINWTGLLLIWLFDEGGSWQILAAKTMSENQENKLSWSENEGLNEFSTRISQKLVHK